MNDEETTGALETLMHTRQELTSKPINLLTVILRHNRKWLLAQKAPALGKYKSEALIQSLNKELNHGSHSI